MSFFFRRGSERRGRWLTAKLWLFAIGAAVAVAGMSLDDARVIGAAIAILAIGLLLRFFPHPDR